jgi:hypothetical protein
MARWWPRCFVNVAVAVDLDHRLLGRMPVFTPIAKAILFLSSYSPLFLILAARASPTNQIEAFVFGGVGLLSIVALFLLLRGVDTVAPTPLHVIKAVSKSSETTGYLVTYVIPFLTLGTASLADVVALVILLVTFGLVFLNSDLVLVNPILAMLGYRLFEVEAPEGRMYLVISKAETAPVSNKDMAVRRLGADIAKAV